MNRLIVIFLLLFGTASATTYYVKPDGNNDSAGTSWATAWAHPNKTNGFISGGDTVRIAPATYDTVCLYPPVNTSGVYTVYACSSQTSIDTGRATTILNGGYALADAWTSRGSNIYRYNNTISEIGNAWKAGYMIVQADNELLSGQTSLANLNSAGETFYDASSDSLFVRMSDNSSPSGNTIRVCQRPVVRFDAGNQDAVQFIGLTLELGYQGTAILAHSDGSTDASDSLEFHHCNIQHAGTAEGGTNVAPFFASNQGGEYPSTLARMGRFNKAVGCTIRSSMDASAPSSGIEIYAQQYLLIDSCYVGSPSDPPNHNYSLYFGVGFKYGGSGDAYLGTGNVIRYSEFVNCRSGVWWGAKQDSLLIYGNYIIDCIYRGIDIHSTVANVSYKGRCKIFNNTIYNCGSTSDPDNGEGIMISPWGLDSLGRNEIRYNIIFDTATTASYAIRFKTQGGEAPEQTPALETVWDIDSNLYYVGSGTFAVAFTGNSGCSGTNFSSWQSCGFDAHGSATTNPNFAASQTPDLSRPSASAEMNRTYGGRTWTIYGAWQPEEEEVDSCIQIVGKTSLPTADTCYCIHDSLLYTFATYDTLINTNGKDNVRIYGHRASGRAFIGYSTADTGVIVAHADQTSKGPRVIAGINSDNLVIKDLAIVPRTIPDSARHVVPLSLSGVSGLLMQNDSLVAAGISSRAFQAWTTYGTSSQNLDLYQSYFGTISEGYDRTDQQYGTTVAFESGLRSASGYVYGIKVHQCRVHTVHTGIAVTGGSRYPIFYIDSNTVTSDTRNDVYMDYDDDDRNNSAGDPYGISCDGAYQGSRISGNTVNSMASTYYGGDGLLIQHVSATTASPLDVYGNLLYLQHGAHPHIAEGRQAAVGVYVRNYDDPYFVSGLHLHDNLGYIVVDTNTSTTYRGKLAEGVRVGFDNGSVGNIIERNHFSIVAADSATRTTNGVLDIAGLSLVQRDSLYTGKDSTGRGLIIRNNYWRTPKNPIWLGETRIGYGVNNVHVVGDTCNALYAGDSTFARFHQSGTYFDHHFQNTFQDMILQGYADYGDVINGTLTDTTQLAYPPENKRKQGKQLGYLRTQIVNVKDQSSANINGASVWAIDAYGNRYDFAATNGSGNSTDTLRWRFFGYDALPADGYAVQDSASYNPFTFWAKSGSDSTNDTMTVNWSSAATMNLQIVPLSAGEPSENKYLRGVSLRGVTIK